MRDCKSTVFTRFELVFGHEVRLSCLRTSCYSMSQYHPVQPFCSMFLSSKIAFGLHVRLPGKISTKPRTEWKLSMIRWLLTTIFQLEPRSLLNATACVWSECVILWSLHSFEEGRGHKLCDQHPREVEDEHFSFLFILPFILTKQPQTKQPQTKQSHTKQSKTKQPQTNSLRPNSLRPIRQNNLRQVLVDLI